MTILCHSCASRQTSFSNAQLNPTQALPWRFRAAAVVGHDRPKPSMPTAPVWCVAPKGQTTDASGLASANIAHCRISNPEIDIFDTANSGTQTQESRMKAKLVVEDEVRLAEWEIGNSLLADLIGYDPSPAASEPSSSFTSRSMQPSVSSSISVSLPTPIQPRSPKR